MAEARNAGITRAMIANAADGGPPRDLDPVAGWIRKADEVAHHARISLLARADMHGMAKLVQFGRCLIEVLFVRDCEAGDLKVRITRHIAKGVLPSVGLEMPRSFAPFADLEAKDVSRKSRRTFEVGCA